MSEKKDEGNGAAIEDPVKGKITAEKAKALIGRLCLIKIDGKIYNTRISQLTKSEKLAQLRGHSEQEDSPGWVELRSIEVLEDMTPEPLHDRKTGAILHPHANPAVR